MIPSFARPVSAKIHAFLHKGWARHLADVEFADILGKQEGAMPEPVMGHRYQTLGEFLQEHDNRVAQIKRLVGEKALENAKAEADSHGAKQVSTVVKSGDPANAILGTSDECEANLIVMGSRGLGGIKSLMLGSVSHKVANLSPTNVITVR